MNYFILLKSFQANKNTSKAYHKDSVQNLFKGNE